eukprot:CAMPEP_0113881414 /NCGR_PEP_ID=MMETSP0780_2-20120614/8364_1 /TAXON_ID=652834 /ORGANISM="Palpitomonas bilix" /LENGTH=138 /DNA_ID=CAMNT_0000868271 /DNA_START=319 /DNA_END=735 /DNA_ORIENTATION=+ /assembly_acc=CAM_ASM_000599
MRCNTLYRIKKRKRMEADNAQLIAAAAAKKREKEKEKEKERERERRQQEAGDAFLRAPLRYLQQEHDNRNNRLRGRPRHVPPVAELYRDRPVQNVARPLRHREVFDSASSSDSSDNSDSDGDMDKPEEDSDDDDSDDE